MKKLTFQVIEGVDKGRIFRELPIPITIGREEGNMLRLNDERISRFHAKVQQEDDDIILTDLDSTNGTRVNGAPVQIRRLRLGDSISLGRSTLLFGTREEIAARVNEHQSANNTTQRIGEAASASPGTVPGEDIGFDFSAVQNTNAVDRTACDWAKSELDMPPLPTKLNLSQSARLSDVFDFLHRGLVIGTENIQANEDGSEVRIGYAEWQAIQATQLFLARYVRMVASPENSVDDY
ncbi:MAG: FHA domain-containing protein [Zavarzinella sp.]